MSNDKVEEINLITSSSDKDGDSDPNSESLLNQKRKRPEKTDKSDNTIININFIVNNQDNSTNITNQNYSTPNTQTTDLNTQTTNNTNTNNDDNKIKHININKIEESSSNISQSQVSNNQTNNNSNNSDSEESESMYKSNINNENSTSNNDKVNVLNKKNSTNFENDNKGINLVLNHLIDPKNSIETNKKSDIAEAAGKWIMDTKTNKSSTSKNEGKSRATKGSNKGGKASKNNINKINSPERPKLKAPNSNNLKKNNNTKTEPEKPITKRAVKVNNVSINNDVEKKEKIDHIQENLASNLSFLENLIGGVSNSDKDDTNNMDIDNDNKNDTNTNDSNQQESINDNSNIDCSVNNDHKNDNNTSDSNSTNNKRVLRPRGNKNKNKKTNNNKCNTSTSTNKKKNNSNTAATNNINNDNSYNQPNSNNSTTQSPNKKPTVIKYPIDDFVLYQNPRDYNLNIECLKKPCPQEFYVPPQKLGQIMNIWSFVMNFKEILCISQFTPEELYFTLLFDKEKDHPLINELFISLLKVLLNHLHETTEPKDFENDLELLILRETVEFTDFKKSLPNCWIEMTKIFILSEKFKYMGSDDLLNIAENIGDINKFNINSRLKYEDKVAMLEFLINSLYDVGIIKQKIRNDFFKQSQLSKEKQTLETDSLGYKFRKNELEYSDGFKNAKKSIITLSSQLEHLRTHDKNNYAELNKYKKQLDTQKKIYSNITKEYDKITNEQDRIQKRYEVVQYELNHSKYNKIILGTDGLKNEYFFYNDYCTRLFVKSITNTLWVDNKKHNVYEWQCFTYKEDVENLMSSLSEKGIRESKLLVNLKCVYPDQLKLRSKPKISQTMSIRKLVNPNNPNPSNNTDTNTSSTFDYPANTVIQDSDYNNPNLTTSEINQILIEKGLKYENTQKINLNQNSSKPNATANSTDLLESKSDLDTLSNITANLFDLEKRMTDFLFYSEREWECSENRELWKSFVESHPFIQTIKSSILLLNERFKNSYKIHDYLPINNKTNLMYKDCVFISPEGHIKIEALDKRRILANKTKIWVKELEFFNVESIFYDYVNLRVNSIPSLNLTMLFFEGVVNSFIKKRESYYRKEEKRKLDEEEQQAIAKSEHDKRIEQFNVVQQVNYIEQLYVKQNQMEKLCKTDQLLSGFSNWQSSMDIHKEMKEMKKGITENKNNTSENSNLRINNINKNNNFNHNEFHKPNNNFDKKIDIKPVPVSNRDLCYICNGTGKLITCNKCFKHVHSFCGNIHDDSSEYICNDCIVKNSIKSKTLNKYIL